MEDKITIIEGPSKPDLGLLNYKTAIAQALIGHKIGDTIVAKLPLGLVHLRIIKIEKG